MAIVQIADVVVPRIFTPYVQQLTEEKTALIQAGALVRDNMLDNLLAGGGSGAAIGAAIGGGVGAASGAMAKGKQINLPTESRLIFSLKAPVPIN